MTIEIDCSAKEARAFLGQPDVEALNAWLVDETKRRFEENIEAMRPEEMMKTWMSFGGQATDQFRKMMEAATASAMGMPPKP